MLNNTGASGGLTVTGGGSTTQGGDNSGGTIQNTTGHGIALTNTTGPSFRNMLLQNTGDSGVNGTQVNGFSFTDGRITGAGDASDENSITFDDSLTATPNLTGAVTITNDVISQTEAEGIDVLNFGGTISDANVSSNALSDTGDVATPGSAISIIGGGTPTSAANIARATIANNTITDFRAGAGVQVRAGNVNAGGPAGRAGTAGSATDVIAVTGNLMNGGNGGIGNQPDRFFTGGASGIGQGNFNVSNNGTAANRIRNIDCIAIEMQSDGPITMTSTVQNNFINANSAVGCAGIAVGTDDPNNVGAGTHSTLISGNNVTGTDGPGIFPIVRDSGSTMTARVINNTVAAPITTSAARAGIRVDSGSATGDTTLCLEISGNTTAGSTNSGTGTTSPGINLRKQGTDPAVNTFGIEGLAPSPTGTPNVENQVNSLNTSTSGTFGVGGTALLSAQTGFAAAPHHERSLSVAEPFLSEIRIMSFGFAPEGLGALQRPVAADQPEPGAVLAARHDLRRRRPRELRPARPARPDADPRGQRPHPRRDAAASRRTRCHDRRAADAHARRCSATIDAARRRRNARQHPVLAQSTAANLYGRADQPDGDGSRTRSANVGGSQAHLNMQPFLALNFCIALQGIFPSPELRRQTMAQPYVGEIRMFARQLRARRLDVLRGPAAADLRERDAVPPDRHDLRRRRRRATFALPDLRGRIPIHQGNGFILAETGGAEEVTLTTSADPGTLRIRCSRTTRSATTQTRRRTTCSRTAPVTRSYPTAPTARRDAAAPARSTAPAAASRTPTSSRTCASTSSSRCSASSRHQT